MSMSTIIEPRVGAGPFTFGMSRCPISLFDQQLEPETRWDDVVALLELQDLAYVAGDERIDVPELGLTFGFVERGAQDDLRLEWISVEAAGRHKPFTASRTAAR